jgi:hypothetical protein
LTLPLLPPPASVNIVPPKSDWTRSSRSWKSWSGDWMRSVLLTCETIGLTLCVACLTISARTLRDAIGCYRVFRRAEELHLTADARGKGWALIQMRGRWCLFALECLSFAWGLDRLGVLLVGDPIYAPRRFLIYGVLRVLMSALAAGVALANMLAYRKLQ